MKTSTIVILSVVGLAAVGGVVFLVMRKKTAAPKAQSTTDKVVGTISSLIPIATKVAELWTSKDDDE